MREIIVTARKTINVSKVDIANYGMSKSALRISGRRKGIKSHYDSPKWEFSWWDRSTERSWKNHRAAQYRAAHSLV